ncbi:mitochondrial transcription termination factor 3 isoform X1 [Megalopta genalis]|uniref:mitochondrial transcription termination factor 3 isoform X1 n=2 Tax=Megalopta genalis TaxID=115081 RepID=UPI003FD2CEE3
MYVYINHVSADMTLLKSYIILRLTYRRISGITSCLFHNGLSNSNFHRNFTTECDEEKASNQVSKDCHSSKDIASKITRGYVNVSKIENSESSNVSKECNESITEKVTSRESVMGMDCIGLGEHDTNKTVQESLSGSNLKETITLLDTYDLKFNDAIKIEDEKLPGPLDKCNEDLSHIGPYITPTFNFAKFADDSITIQKLVDLGVDLHKLEKHRDLVEMYLSLDFDRDIKPYITFLHDCGLQPENLGRFITKNPRIFKEDMDDLHTRIRYLAAHLFTPPMIQRIITGNPLWLSCETQKIDRRLGHFQWTFKLDGDQIRYLATKCPKLITYNMMHIKENTFSVKEEMGFNLTEIKRILLDSPLVWINSRSKIVNAFDYIHNQMNISHKLISIQSKALTYRKSLLHSRHQFLVELKRNQYDPTKPLYVSLKDVVGGTDIEFCNNVAKASIDTYNLFLKTI